MRRRPSAAMVVAIVALVVAASGTAVAATKLVSGDSLIKKNSLSGNRLRAHTVSGKQIKLGSLGTVRNAAHATTADTATNATQAANATNATTAGSAPIAKLTYVTTSFAVPGDGTTTTGTASCPSGTDATGGGSNIDDTTDGIFFGSFPAGKTGWSATYQDFGGMPATGTVYAICAPAASTAP
ncbi:MAG TPA: hypothetical protein VGF91_27590 [Solirubrobacteraceae bacterium]